MSTARPVTAFASGVPSSVTELLIVASDPSWAGIAADSLTATLADHAHCEKKAAASAMALVSAYPEDTELVMRLSALAIEELDHFREIVGWLADRGGVLSRDEGDPYAKALLAHVRQPPKLRKLDRLLISALIEARSCERFVLLRDELLRRGDAAAAARFTRLANSEAGHATLFLLLARREDQSAGDRLRELCAREAEIVATLPSEPRIH